VQPGLLLDADATVVMRGLSLFSTIIGTSVPLYFTGFIYHHELRSLRDLETLRERGRITIHDVRLRTPENDVRRSLERDAGVDKGEAEAMAWLWAEEERTNEIWFVTLDRRARAVAAARGLNTANVAETAALLVLWEVIGVADARNHLLVWDHRRHQAGRPKDWTTFDDRFPSVLAKLRDL